MTNYIQVLSGKEIDLGKRGEHLARCIVFDISNWQKTYGEGSVHLLHQRNGDTAPYPCVVEVNDIYVHWLLSETDVAVAGRGRVELQYFVDEARVKSETWNTRTHRSLNNEGPIPEEPAENWLNAMLQLGTETQENAEIAEQHAEIAEQSAAEAKTSAQNAIDCENLVYEHAQDARAASENAEAAMNAAEAAQIAAERARDETQAIAGGDIASTVYVNNQIVAHNSNKSAHADIRKIIDDLTAEDVGARSDTWMPSAADVGARPDTWLPTIGEIGAAPAGYGEGTKQDGEKAVFSGVGKQKGWYRIATSNSQRASGILHLQHLYASGGTADFICFVSQYSELLCLKCDGVSSTRTSLVNNARLVNVANGCALDVYNRDATGGNPWSVNIINTGASGSADSSFKLQTPTFIAADDTLPEGETLSRSMEWQNPPMSLGVEYRTTERCEGKPVYAKRVDCGALPVNTVKNSYAGVVGANRLLRTHGTIGHHGIW